MNILYINILIEILIDLLIASHIDISVVINIDTLITSNKDITGPLFSKLEERSDVIVTNASS